jgi:hypothetical protein
VVLFQASPEPAGKDADAEATPPETGAQEIPLHNQFNYNDRAAQVICRLRPAQQALLDVLTLLQVCIAGKREILFKRHEAHDTSLLEWFDADSCAPASR